MELKRIARPFRLRLPDEKRLPWLGMLLDALAVTDAGVTKALERELAAGRVLACGKGCANCCANHMIPVTPLEVMGMSWYARECLQGEARRQVPQRLAEWSKGGSGGQESRTCPFLARGLCAIYPLRPVACRQYHVFTRACAPGEDAYETRRQDVLELLPEYKLAADRLMLPFYGFKTPEEIERALCGQYLRRVSQLLFSCDWSRLAGA